MKATWDKLLDQFDKAMHMSVRAASSTLDWDGNSWQLLTEVSSDSNGKVEVSGLVPGQKYLVIETSPSSSLKPVIFQTDSSLAISKAYDYNTSKSSTAKVITKDSSGYNWLATEDTASASSSASNSASTGSTLKTTGSGTQSSGSSGAGNARGSATGDESNLWLHLIVMLLAFDGLVADLLYISRKKQLVPVKNK